MKKLILLLLLMTELLVTTSANAQNNYVFEPDYYGYDYHISAYIDVDPNLHVIVYIRDSTEFEITSDAFTLSSLNPSFGNRTGITRVMDIDADGHVGWRSISGLPITYEQIIDSLGFVPIETEVDGSVTNEIELPAQTGNAGKHLVTNGSSVSWEAIKRQETYSGTTDANGEYTVTFGSSYSVAPNIQAQVIGGNSNQHASVSVSQTGFTVTVTEKQTTTILGVVVVMDSTVDVSGASVDVLITEK